MGLIIHKCLSLLSWRHLGLQNLHGPHIIELWSKEYAMDQLVGVEGVKTNGSQLRPQNDPTEDVYILLSVDQTLSSSVFISTTTAPSHFRVRYVTHCLSQAIAGVYEQHSLWRPSVVE